MRINELLENKHFKEDDFVQKTGEGRELNFDLAEDLIHFMNQDDDVYRRHTYPAIANCVDKLESKRDPSIGIFKPAVENSYKIYVKKFPIRELPDSLDEELCKQICEKIHEEVVQHINDGKYKE
jgi:hypothetical protein